MRAVEIITKKRSGLALSDEEIGFIIEGYVSGSIPEYQVSALLMAIFYKGMTPNETASLTSRMLRSGDVMDLSGIPGPFVDKHSTGGVGDKISLPLAPHCRGLRGEGADDVRQGSRAYGRHAGQAGVPSPATGRSWISPLSVRGFSPTVTL